MKVPPFLQKKNILMIFLTDTTPPCHASYICDYQHREPLVVTDIIVKLSAGWMEEQYLYEMR